MAGSFGHDGDRLSAFLDDELGERAALEVTRHLQDCDDCRAELEELRSTRSALRSLPPVAPSLSWMVETAVLVPTGDGSRPLPVVAGVVAGLAVLVLAGAFALGGDRGTVQPPVDRLVVDHVRSVDGGPVVTPVQLDDGGRG